MKISTSLVVAVGLLLQNIIVFLIGVITARYLGAADFGAVTLLRNLSLVLLIIAPLGLDVSLLKFSATFDRRSERYSALVTALRTCVAAVSLVLLAVVFFIVGPHLETSVFEYKGFSVLLTITALGVLFSSELAVMGALYRGAAKPAHFAVISNYLQPVLRLALTSLVIATGAGVVGITVANVLTLMIATVISAALYRVFDLAPRSRAAHILLRSTWQDVAMVLRESVWMAASLLVYGTMRFADVLAVGAFASTRSAGIYGAVTSVSQMIQIIPLALSQTLGPRISKLHKDADYEGIRAELKRYIRKASVAGGFVFGGIAAFGVNLDLIFGSDFQVTRTVATLTSLGWLVSSVLAPTGFALSMTGRHREEFWLLLSGSVMLVALLFALVPSYQMEGAAMSILISFSVLNITRFYFVNRVAGHIGGLTLYLLWPVVFFCIGTSIQILGSSLADIDFPNLVVLCFIYALICALLFLLFGLQKSERTLFLNITRKFWHRLALK